MRKLLRPLGLVLALAFLVLTFVNASWLAPGPRGYLKLIAQRGVAQQFGHAGATDGTCTATRIEPPVHDYIENTVRSMLQAGGDGAQLIQLDIAATKDGRIAIFRDRTLACRTDGTGNVRDHTLAELKALDAGYGYTADGGKTFPLRGTGKGLIPSLEDVLAALPEKPLLYTFTGKDPAEADLLAAALEQAGRQVESLGDAFSGDETVIARIRAQFPKAWTFSPASAEACTSAYAWQGWFGVTPAACKNATIMIPLNRQWAFAGWPNRLIARMAAVNARVVLTGPDGAGLDLPEQVGEVPAGFNGYLWVGDIEAVGPALRPQYNRRNPVQEEKFQAALERRRKARE